MHFHIEVSIKRADCGLGPQSLNISSSLKPEAAMEARCRKLVKFQGNRNTVTQAHCTVRRRSGRTLARYVFRVLILTTAVCVQVCIHTTDVCVQVLTLTIALLQPASQGLLRLVVLNLILLLLHSKAFLGADLLRLATVRLQCVACSRRLYVSCVKV